MDEIIDYVMETPGNTNPNVLRGMLNNRGGGGSDILFVNMTVEETDDYFHAILDKTFLEIYSSNFTVVKSSEEDPILDSGYVKWMIPNEIAHYGKTGTFSLTVGDFTFSGYANDFPEIQSGGK